MNKDMIKRDLEDVGGVWVGEKRNRGTGMGRTMVLVVQVASQIGALDEVISGTVGPARLGEWVVATLTKEAVDRSIATTESSGDHEAEFYRFVARLGCTSRRDYDRRASVVKIELRDTEFAIAPVRMKPGGAWLRKSGDPEFVVSTDDLTGIGETLLKAFDLTVELTRSERAKGSR